MARKLQSKLGRLLVIAIEVIMIVVGTYLSTNYGPHLLAIETSELIPFQIDSQKEFEVQMGGFHFMTTTTELSSGLDLSDYIYISSFSYPFQVSLSSERLLVSAEIKNANGDIVAKIASNQWSVNYNPIVTYDRNYNAYALEVIDSDRVPTLQVVMTPENKIFIGGVFYGENATLVAMLNGTTALNPSHINYNQTIFQYPSDSNSGRLVPNSAYAFGGPQAILAPTEIITIGYVSFGIGTFVTLVVGVDSFKKRDSKKSKRRKSASKKKSRSLAVNARARYRHILLHRQKSSGWVYFPFAEKLLVCFA
jgi:hypothetical protein